MSEGWFSAGGTRANLARLAARGALVSLAGQGANLVLRTLSMAVIARYVTPEHFGLVGMVTVLTGLLSLFRDGGLGAATVQRETISEELISTLFWINVAIGFILALLTVAIAPLLVAFYSEPRLLWITIALAITFIFNGAMTQHRAMLQRRMQFGVMTAIDILALILSIGIGVLAALLGLGYWALVAMTVSQPMIILVGFWVASGWKPGPPRRSVGVGSMVRYGGLITLHALVSYLSFNTDKVLLGRVFGSAAIGIYGRAYELIHLPTANLYTTLGWVLFPALARVQEDPVRLRNLFLKAYGLFLSVVTPVTVACGLFADEVIWVFLGPQWVDAVPLFRLLVPTVMAVAMMNPMGQLMQATGQAGRSVKLALFMAPVMMIGYSLGLSNGAQGVALGLSASMMLIVGPYLYWSRKHTLISMVDLARTVAGPFVCTLAGGAVAMLVSLAIPASDVFLRFAILPAVLLLTHFVALAFLFNQRHVYAKLVQRVFD